MVIDRVHYVAHPPGDGLGDAAAGYRRLLGAAGVEVSSTLLRWGWSGLEPDPGPRPGPEAVVIVHILLEWAERALDWFPDGRRLALVTWEADAIPADVVAALNRYDGVIVPSSFNLPCSVAAV